VAFSFSRYEAVRFLLMWHLKDLVCSNDSHSEDDLQKAFSMQCTMICNEQCVCKM
jgi:hypothetical protein